MFILLKRVIKTGWKGFRRNIGLSLATILIMVIVISLATLLFLLNPVSKILIADIEKKVDISVYFKEDISSEYILEVESEISKIPEVKDVEYISKEQALEKFIEKHKDDPVLMESLTELGSNPFLASLNIMAWEPSQYEQVASFLETSSFRNLIDKVDYYERKPVIEKVFSVVSGLNKIGIFFSIVFAVIAVLIAFNTVRIAIYNSGEEISVMRLIGASNWFVRGPFLIQGIIIGFIAVLITLLITFGLCYGFDARIKTIAPDISIYSIFVSNFFLLFLIQLATGIGLGIISSYIAVRKYLKI
ncbi:ABC transporter permease [Patescibacteria group bacterium]|nr:ABC transporter permease [Patescibacteria group bacterium]